MGVHLVQINPRVVRGGIPNAEGRNPGPAKHGVKTELPIEFGRRTN